MNLLHQWHDGPSQGRRAVACQSAGDDAVLLRRRGCHRPGRLHRSRGADVTRLGAVRAAASGAWRQPRDSGKWSLRRLRGGIPPTGTCRGDHVPGTDDDTAPARGTSAGVRGGGRLEDAHLRRGPHVRAGPAARDRLYRVQAGPGIWPGRVADDHCTVVAGGPRRYRPPTLSGAARLHRHGHDGGRRAHRGRPRPLPAAGRDRRGDRTGRSWTKMGFSPSRIDRKT